MTQDLSAESPSKKLALLVYLPGGPQAVARIYQSHGGNRAVRKLKETQHIMKKGFGVTDEEALVYAISLTMGAEEARIAYGGRPQFSGLFSRITAAVFSMGVSEGVRAIPGTDDFMDELENAFEDGWDSFSDSIEYAVKNIKNIDDLGDVLNVVKIVATGGGSLLAESGINALQEVIFKQLNPYIQRIGKEVGEGYAVARIEGIKPILKGIDKWDAPKIIKRIAKEFIDTLWDIILGNPTCMCEPGCAGPVAKALKDSGNSYVQLIGQIIGIVAPIAQKLGYEGEYANVTNYANAPCLYVYAENAVPMLPSVRLDEETIGGVANVIEFFNKDFAKKMTAGMPQAFNNYHDWLVDMVARGYDGPRLMFGSHHARYYFDHPDKAAKVLKESSTIQDVVDQAGKWIDYINKAAKYISTAKDMYEEVKDVDFSDIDISKINIEDIKDYISIDTDQLRELGGWALDTGKDYAMREAVAKANELADESGLTDIYNTVNEAKRRYKQVQGELASGTDRVQALQDAIERGKGGTSGEGIGTTLMSFGKSKFSGLENANFGGASSTTLAVMGEWMPALIGTEARAKYNDMLALWSSMSHAERDRWKNAPKEYWATKHTDYREWYKKFSKSNDVAKYCFNRNTPTQYTKIRDAVVALWPSLSEYEREAMRIGKPVELKTKYVPKFDGISDELSHGVDRDWSYRMPYDGGEPTVSDVGWPIGAGRSGRRCRSTQYWAYVCDWLDVHDNYSTAAAYYRVLWKSLPNDQRLKWIRTKSTNAYSPIVANRLDDAAVQGAYNRFLKNRVPKAATKIDKDVLATVAKLAQPTTAKKPQSWFSTRIFAGMIDVTISTKGQFTRRRFWSTIMSIEMPSTNPQMYVADKPQALAILPKIFQKEDRQPVGVATPSSRDYSSAVSTGKKINPALAAGLGIAGTILVAGIAKKTRQ